MKTTTSLLGTPIPEGTRGLLYLCKYNYSDHSLKVVAEKFFLQPFEALESFANIPNPESQLALETKQESFDDAVTRLHDNMGSPEWRKELSNHL